MSSDLRNLVSMTSRGGIILGPHVVCDGFAEGVKVRVQSHTHDDHMSDFETSKGSQEIYMSSGSKDLLIAEKGGDLHRRSNLIAIETGVNVQSEKLQDSQIMIMYNGHMLGSVQIVVTLRDGTRLGYSGDFDWPLEETITADVLVLDATYGDPQNVREYKDSRVDEVFQETLHTSLARGPVNLKAHRGTLHRALDLIESSTPVIVSPHRLKEINVYQKHGYDIDNVFDYTTEEAKIAMKSGRFITVRSKGDNRLTELKDGMSQIILSAYMGEKDYPLLSTGNKHRVAMTNHSDFPGVLEYVKRVNPKLVLTDNGRHGSPVTLASEIKRQLGIDARILDPSSSREWGK